MKIKNPWKKWWQIWEPNFIDHDICNSTKWTDKTETVSICTHCGKEVWKKSK